MSKRRPFAYSQTVFFLCIILSEEGRTELGEGLERQADQMRYPGKDGRKNNRLLFQKQADGGADCIRPHDGGGDGQMNMQEALRQLQSNPEAFIKQMGVNVPAEIMNNPQAMVMHLINTNQFGGPMLQRIMPMIRQMGGMK